MQTTPFLTRESAFRLDLSQASVLLHRPGPKGQPLDDPAAAVAASLASPLEFPPLAQAITPDDHVALALAPGVPQAEAIIAGVVYALTEAGILAEHIVIVQDAVEAGIVDRDVTAGLPDLYRSQIRLVTHDPRDREKLAFLSPSNDGKPIYFTREINDAELVIPIVCLQADDVLGNHGPSAGLYPTFGDEEAQQRFHALSSHDEPVHRQRRAKEADEAAWLLGVLLTIGVLPGEDDGVLHVLAGERGAVAKESQRLCEQAWNFDVPQRADLVIATIAGGPEQQTWQNVGRALQAATRAVTEDGAIVICSELDTPPGPSMQRLAADGTSDEALSEIRRDRFSDTLTAARLGRVLETRTVYLRSRLREDMVESLGLAHVSSDDEVARLSQRHASCIFIGSAQHAVPREVANGSE